MKTQKEVSYKSMTTDKTFCDICKQEINKGGYTYGEAEITGSYGSHYPEGTSITRFSIDCCFDCYENKIIPLLEKTFKLKFLEEDINY